MKSEEIYAQVKEEFADEWSRNTVEGLLETNNYKRAREEYNLYEHFLPKDQWILEGGCGLGPKLLYFKNKGFKIIGVDFVPSALERLKNYDEDTLLACCDIHSCPFEDEAFGAYLSYGVVEHFPHGSQDAVNEAYRVLKKDGVILMMVPAANALSRFIHDPNNFIQRLKKIPWVRKIAGKSEWNPSHEHDLFLKLHRRSEMRNILETAGFEILLEEPVSHSFSLYMLCECFHADSNGKTNVLAEATAWVLKNLNPWGTANHFMFIGKK
jgi:SAM-dependent methyltransferase